MSSQESVAIFWDYENCQPASSSSGYTVIDYIRRIALQFGVVTVFKAYLELGKTGPSKVKTLLSELQSSGVSLINCPHNGCKEVADKMLLVDVMAHAIDDPAPGTIILISGDRDFVYAVSTLRLRRYRVVVIASSQIHISLHRQASLVYRWNGGKADSVQTTMLRMFGESGSQSDSFIDRDSFVPRFPPFPSPFRKDGLGRASHASPSTLTHASSTTINGSERCLVEVDGRRMQAPVSLLNAPDRLSLSGVCHALEGPQGKPASQTNLALSPSTIGSSWRGQQEAVDHLPTSTTEALESVASHDVSARTPVHKQIATQSPTGVAEPQLRTGSPLAGTSAPSESFRLVGRRIIRNMKCRERAVVWRHLARNMGSVSDISDVHTARTEEFVLTNLRYTKHIVWKKCRATLVSLLTFKRGISTGFISSTPPSSSSSAFTTASVMSTVTNSPPALMKPEDGVVNGSAVMRMLAAHETSDNVVAPSEAEELLHSPTQFTDIISTASYSETEPSETKPSQSFAKDGNSDLASVAAVTCMSESTLSKTLTTTSAPANTLIAVAKYERLSTAVNSVEISSSLEARAVVLSKPVLSPTPSNAAIVTNLAGPSPPMVQSATTSAVIRSRSKFVVLVEELRCLHHQGQDRPRRSMVAEGLMKRDPLIYQRAGVATKFDTYISLAVQAGVVTVGGKKQKWISLNPAWLIPPAAPDDTTSVGTHTTALVTSPNAADNLPESSRNVPPEFVLLVERLKRLESKDTSQPFRSLVAADLVFQDRAVYQKAGVNNFDAYASLAAKAGLVTLGGEGLRTWISLKA